MKGGPGQNMAEAIFWFRKAADVGQAKAESQLGMMYAAGMGVEHDPQQAIR
jgi:TPR repeat protein